jgi:hypothetical protein
MAKLPDEEKVTHELHDLEQVQLFLSGLEVYSLIVAVQIWKATSCGKLDKTMKVAELTARKLHKAFIPCPNVYTLLDQGWNLESKPDSTTKTNDTLS